MNEVIQRHAGMVQIFMLVVDRDGQLGRHDALRRIEEDVQPSMQGATFICVCAIEEIEAWILAGADDLPASWKVIRGESQLKERYYLPYATSRGVASAVAEGRRILAGEAVRHWERVLQRCPEDLGVMVARLRELR